LTPMLFCDNIGSRMGKGFKTLRREDEQRTNQE
jgi:hypothetical protein